MADSEVRGGEIQFFHYLSVSASSLDTLLRSFILPSSIAPRCGAALTGKNTTQRGRGSRKPAGGVCRAVVSLLPDFFGPFPVGRG